MSAQKKLLPIQVAEQGTPVAIAGHQRFVHPNNDAPGEGYSTFADANACRAVVMSGDGSTIRLKAEAAKGCAE